MLILVHNNPIFVNGESICVDRKFQVGMKTYLESIRSPILSVHPLALPGHKIMDEVRLPKADLGYEVLALPVDAAGRLLPKHAEMLADRIGSSKLVYGYGYGSSEIARKLDIPYILLIFP